MRLGKTTVVHFGSHVVISLAGFLATFLIARFLGADGLGKYAVAVALGYFWLAIPANAIANALTKRVSEGVDPGAYLSLGFILNGGYAAASVAVILAFKPWIDAYIGAPVSLLLAMLVVGSVFFVTVIAAMQGQKKVAESGILKALERVGRTSLQIALLIVGYGVGGLIVGHFFSLLMMAVIGLYFLEIGFVSPRIRHLHSLISYAKYAWLGMLKSRVFGWLDVMVLAFFVTPSLIGIYEAAWGIASLLAMASTSIQTTLFPEMSELSVTSEFDRIKHYLNEGLVYSGIFIIPGLFGGLVLGERVLRIYRTEFTQGAGILVILILAYVAEVYGTQLTNALNAIDRPDIAFRINTAFIIANVILNVTLVYLYGWWGAAVATAISTGLTLILGYYSLVKIIGQLEIPFAEIGRELAAALLMGTAVYFMANITPSGHYLTMGLVVFGATVYSVTLISISARIRQKTLALLAEVRVEASAR